jgi:hypothetical protein
MQGTTGHVSVPLPAGNRELGAGLSMTCIALAQAHGLFEARHGLFGLWAVKTPSLICLSRMMMHAMLLYMYIHTGQDGKECRA